MSVELYEFQKGSVGERKAIALYWDMGLGKTYGGINRAEQWQDEQVLIICQKSKINDWVESVYNYTGESCANLRNAKENDMFLNNAFHYGVLNYDMLWKRREELKQLQNYTLILDESSLIKNPKAQRTKAVFKLKYSHLVLLSGTPCSGKYEELITQCHLLGWKIDPEVYIDRYTMYLNLNVPGKWKPVRKFIGYKNVRELKKRLVDYGADFKLSKDYIDLPKQTYTNVTIDRSRDYSVFEKTLVFQKEDGDVITGDTPLVKLLRLRQMCNSKEKQEALSDLLEGTDDRVIVFYNFNEEKDRIIEACSGRPLSFINGETVDLSNYREYSNSVTLCQYQAGAYGHNLQLANKMVFYSPPLSSELYDQAQKRIHRIGQDRPCFYWRIITKKTIEEKIYDTLQMRQDYTMRLFTEHYLEGVKR